MNTEWALNELRRFIDDCEKHSISWKAAGQSALDRPDLRKLHDSVVADIPVIQRIADRVWPDWVNQKSEFASMGGWEYDKTLGTARRVLVLLERREELEKNLGELGPTLAAGTMHANVWQASKALWGNGHLGEAVVAAARSVNAALQTKVGRRDLSESKLLSESFSLEPPKPGAPRLRLMDDDGSESYKNIHQGVISYGVGCFRAIRNVLAHEYGKLSEPPEHEALQYLAAFSVLATWIDQAEVIK